MWSLTDQEQTEACNGIYASKEVQGESHTSLWSVLHNHTTAASEAQGRGHREHSDLELRYLCFARLPSVQSVISRPSGSPGHCTCPRWLYHVSILLMPSPLFRFPEGKSAASGQSFPLPPPLLPRYSGAHTWLLQTFTWGYKSALKN